MSTIKMNEEEFPQSVLKSPKPKYLKPKIRPSLFILNKLNDSEESSISSEEIINSKIIKDQNLTKNEKLILNCLVKRKESSKTLQDSKGPSRTSSNDVFENKDVLLLINEESYY